MRRQLVSTFFVLVFAQPLWASGAEHAIPEDTKEAQDVRQGRDGASAPMQGGTDVPRFAQLDANQDGTVSREEVVNQFQRADLDGDGALNATEFSLSIFQ